MTCPGSIFAMAKTREAKFSQDPQCIPQPPGGTASVLSQLSDWQTWTADDLSCIPFFLILCQSPDSPFVLTATSTFSLSRARALKDSEEDCARSVCTLLSQRGRPEQINITHHTGAELSRKNIPHTFTTEILQCALRYERGKEHYGGQRTHHIHVHLAEKIPAKLPAFQDTEKRILGPKPQYFLIIPT